MNRVGEFEKVSFEQFRIAMDDAFHDIGYTEDELREIWEAIPLPVRATSGLPDMTLSHPSRLFFSRARQSKSQQESV